MKTGDLVKITKLRQSEQPLARSGNWDTYIPGSWSNTDSLPVDYVMIGFLVCPPVVGSQVQLVRLIRNGVRVTGIFTSTAVVSVAVDGFTTKNSVYLMEPYADPQLLG